MLLDLGSTNQEMGCRRLARADVKAERSFGAMELSWNGLADVWALRDVQALWSDLNESWICVSVFTKSRVRRCRICNLVVGRMIYSGQVPRSIPVDHPLRGRGSISFLYVVVEPVLPHD